MYRCAGPLRAVRQASRPCAEALAHAMIFGTFMASAVCFGTSNLEGSVTAMRHMSGQEAVGFSMRPMMSSVRLEPIDSARHERENCFNPQFMNYTAS